MGSVGKIAYLLLAVLFVGGAALEPLPGRVADHYQTENGNVEVETIATGLQFPWAVAFLPDGSALVTEKPGRLRHVSGHRLSAPIKGVPMVHYDRQGGLLDVAVDPEFDKTGTIFLTYAEPDESGAVSGTAVARARLVLDENPRLEDFKVIFSLPKKSELSIHFGSRIVFADDGTLFVTVGDRYISEEKGLGMRAQDPFDPAGSVLRLNKDGSIPADNPFADGKKAHPAIWSIGHRNPQGAVWNKDTHSLWTVAHAARGGDEINHPEAGKNYGWPIITYGVNYNGEKIGVGTHKEGMEQPVYYWDPSIAPSGMVWYDGAAFPAWHGNLFVGALKDEMIVRLELKDGKVVHEERMLQSKYGRVRDVRQGPDGNLYFVTDERKGKLYRIKPAAN
ncbi:PQQ-dependent sugar dehydrogenase [Emcibacter nanhaiensis]|uniref:PQQ-dependent sugar dehydrogenase n=1 Tax=Emcibacter nanhaiensis TaxID=1505037 RepID=A0A501PSA7_9PROT|nr:PQQ-dependent sugar dehydrogenase [Emcibacter nanhaiensis]TPD63125.1 PQQ-dependent sugar dehydrogenase [Emcibacter nanhaiensis]